MLVRYQVARGIDPANRGLAPLVGRYAIRGVEAQACALD